jgi:hypothetical protein
VFPKKIAYAVVDCTTVPATLISAYNVDSVTTLGVTGEWRCNITSGTFSNGNYVCLLTGSAKPGVGIDGTLVMFGQGAAHTATNLDFFSLMNNTNTDLPLISIFMMGD